jgi:toxin-antitoxin system PIN domain toxin
MISLVFPDVNVWLALSYPPHIHHEAAENWYESASPSPTLVFCRHTQLSLFRLLSTEAILKQDVLSQRRCWEEFDQWIGSGEAIYAEEPAGLESVMRARTSAESVSPKTWADAYLASFAEKSNLPLVTFDRALAGKVKGAVLLST